MRLGPDDLRHRGRWVAGVGSAAARRRGHPALSVAIVVPANGRSRRLGEEKLWVELAGRPLLEVTLASVHRAALFDRVVVVTPSERWATVADLGRRVGVAVELVEGGDRRQESVRLGLRACEGMAHVCVHDAARPLCPPALFQRVVAEARAHGAATAAIPPVDTIKRVAGGVVVDTLDRAALVATQTPQAFDRALLIEAHARAQADLFEADDDCALVERTGHPVRVVDGDLLNFKVTHRADVLLARSLLARMGEDVAQ